jgi:hypothetical protein
MLSKGRENFSRFPIGRILFSATSGRSCRRQGRLADSSTLRPKAPTHSHTVCHPARRRAVARQRRKRLAIFFAEEARPNHDRQSSTLVEYGKVREAPFAAARKRLLSRKIQTDYAMSFGAIQALRAALRRANFWDPLRCRVRRGFLRKQRVHGRAQL